MFMKKSLLTLALVVVLGSSATYVYAQPPAQPAAQGQPPSQKPALPEVTNPSSQASGFLLDVKLQNPLKVSTIEEAIKFFITTILKIAIPFIVVFFIWAGLKFILAQGKPDKIKEAKNMFWFTIIGTLLILGAYTITNAIIGTINSVVG